MGSGPDSTSGGKGEKVERKYSARAGMRGKKRKEGKDPEGGSKKRKEVVKDRDWKRGSWTGTVWISSVS